jgi:tetratricopeptide (TPR) repeat protein
MTPLKKELDLFYDSELNFLLDSKKDGSLIAYESLAMGLNIRAMIGLASKISREGLLKFPRSKKLFKELILANSISEESLNEIENDLKESKLEKEEKLKLFALLKYFKDDSNWYELLKKGEIKEKDELYYELLGHHYTEKKEYQKAIEAYFKASNIVSSDPRLHYYRIEAIRASGDKEQSYKELIDLVRNFDYFIQGWNGIERFYLEDEKLSLGYQAFGKALSINPNDWGAFFVLADFYLNKKSYGRARDIIEILLSLEPNKWVFAEGCNYLGYLFSLDNRNNEAQFYLEKSLEINPKLSEAWYNLGNIFFHQKKFNDALSCYENAAASDEKMAQAYTQIGLTLLEMGKFSQSEKPFKKAIEIDETEYFAHLGLAEYYRKMKQKEKAIEHAIIAKKLRSDEPNVYNILGTIYESFNQFEKAEECYKKALEIDPMYRWSANNLGYLYEKMMKKDPKYKKKAIEAWKTRLLITYKMGSSIKGAVNHLLKLGLKPSSIKHFIEKAKD